MFGIAGFYALCWLGCFVLGLWADEDVNHWDWPADGGPKPGAMLKIAGAAAAVALIPLALLLGVGLLAKFLGDL